MAIRSSTSDVWLNDLYNQRLKMPHAPRMILSRAAGHLLSNPTQQPEMTAPGEIFREKAAPGARCSLVILRPTDHGSGSVSSRSQRDSFAWHGPAGWPGRWFGQNPCTVLSSCPWVSGRS